MIGRAQIVTRVNWLLLTILKLDTRHYTQKVFYALYIRPNDADNRHLIYRLSTDQILVTKEYRLVPISDDLFEAMNPI